MSYKQGFVNGEIDMELLRSRQSLDKAKKAYESGDSDNHLRSYHLPKYQLDMIDYLAKDSGLSKAGVIRQIIADWYDLRVKPVEVNGQ